MDQYKIISFFLIINNFLLYGKSFSPYFERSELVKINISKLYEADAVLHKNNSHKVTSIRVSFRGFEKIINFTAITFQTSQIVSIQRNERTNSSTNNWKTNCYEKKFNSSDDMFAFGCLQGNVFIGFVSSGRITYVLEPLASVSKTNSTSMAVVYKYSDVVYPKNLLIDFVNNLNHHFYSVKDSIRFMIPTVDYSVPEELACEIEIYGDYTLYEKMEENQQRAEHILYLHAKYADRIFRTTDFGKVKVRIIPKHVTIDTKRRFHPSKSASETLHKLKLIKHDYCFSIYVYDYPFDVPEETYFTNTKANKSGICAERQSRGTWDVARSNVGIISMQTKFNETIPLSVSYKLFTRVLGNAFGSSFDYKKNLKCSSNEKNLGYYLMNGKEEEYISKYWRDSFSPCSIKSMTSLIHSRKNCLKQITNSICGNSVREKEEECDCGKTLEDCSETDPCCTPRDGIGTDKGCKFRRSRGSYCSPSENECCESNCKITKEYKRCYWDDENCLIGVCDGKSRNCPSPQSAPDGTACMFMSRTCNKGKCNSTICLDNNLSNCICKERNFSCHVCCKNKTDECKPAWKFGFYSLNNEIYNLIPDTSCAGNSSSIGKCDIHGLCLSLAKGQRTDSFTKINGTVIISVICALCAMILIVGLIFLAIEIR